MHFLWIIWQHSGPFLWSNLLYLSLLFNFSWTFNYQWLFYFNFEILIDLLILLLCLWFWFPNKPVLVLYENLVSHCISIALFSLYHKTLNIPIIKFVHVDFKSRSVLLPHFIVIPSLIWLVEFRRALRVDCNWGFWYRFLRLFLYILKTSDRRKISTRSLMYKLFLLYFLRRWVLIWGLLFK